METKKQARFGQQSKDDEHKKQMQDSLLEEAKKIKKVRKTSSLFEDGRKTKRQHFLYALISKCLMAFTVLCLCLSLITKEFELQDLKSKQASKSPLIRHR